MKASAVAKLDLVLGISFILLVFKRQFSKASEGLT